MKVSVKDGKISNLMTIGKRLEGFGEVRVVNESNGLGLDFVAKIENRFWISNVQGHTESELRDASEQRSFIVE